ncbi:MAG: hypothetical protein DMF57_08400 [Acidobacteria bacterium]|nr:MAG: hypothetical protein DMF57_08400 [Acidobacteriota bacterium]
MNGTLNRRMVVVSLFLAVIVVPRGFAQAARVFLSGTGTDAGDCSNAAAPCRSLQYAIDQAAAGAEVVVVSSGGYGGAFITKSITVNAPTGVVAFVGRTISVQIGTSDTVTLRGLSMNGAVFGDANGIHLAAGGTLNVENTVISSFANDGIYDTAALAHLWVHNCDFKKNGSAGIEVALGSAVIENSRAVENVNYGVIGRSGTAVAIRNSVAQRNFIAFYAIGGTTELIVDSCLATHNGYGVYSQAAVGTTTTVVRIGESVMMSNATANLFVDGGGQIISQGGNRIGGATGGTTGFTSTEAQQ